MKNHVFTILAALLCLCFVLPVFADTARGEAANVLCSDGAVLMGGTVKWPEMRGHRFGSSMQQVMLKEESLGSGFVFYDYGGNFQSPADLAKNSRFDAHFLSTSLTVLDRPAVFDYRFGNNALTSVQIGIPVNDQTEGNGLLKTLADETTRLYGAEYNVSSGEHQWHVGYGFQRYAVHQDQAADKGFSGRILLSCTQSAVNYDQWQEGQWWVNLSISQTYCINTSDRTASPAYTIW